MADQSILSSRAIMGMYFARLDANPEARWLAAVSDLFDSDQRGEIYPFLGAPPAMREWIGGRHAKGLNGWAVSVPNSHYEATLEVAVADARRDKSSQLSVRIQEFADRSASHWGRLMGQLIVDGESGLCYDGAAYFSTTHVLGNVPAQSNIASVDISELPVPVHGIPSQPSLAELQWAVGSGVMQIRSFLDDQGEPANELASDFTVLAAPTLAARLGMALSADATAAMPGNLNPNLHEGTRIEVHQSARLAAWTDRFAVFRTDAKTKAMIRQQEGDLKMSALGEGSEHEFKEDSWLFGINSWRAVAYGHWQRACLVKLV